MRKNKISPDKIRWYAIVDTDGYFDFIPMSGHERPFSNGREVLGPFYTFNGAKSQAISWFKRATYELRDSIKMIKSRRKGIYLK